MPPRQHRRSRQRVFTAAIESAEVLESRQLLTVQVAPLINLNPQDTPVDPNTQGTWSEIREMTTVGSQVFFVAADVGQDRHDLWRTDGTSAGTLRLADLGPKFRESRLLTNVNGTVFFRGYDSVHGQELWKTDGTVEGTRLVRDFRPGSAGSTLSDFLEHNGQLLFAANGHLSRSDGTTQGTVRITDLVPDVSDDVAELTKVGNSVYFRARNTSGTSSVYRTNGTRSGTAVVDNSQASHIGDIANIGGTMFFTKDVRSLWKTGANGTTAELVKDSSQGAFYPQRLADVAGIVFFESQGALWKSDGTGQGTQLVRNIGYSVNEMFNFNGTLYFAGGTGVYESGEELWKSDGTAAGTVMVKDIAPGFDEGLAWSSYPGSFSSRNGTLYFLANGGLWTTDGTANGTVPFQSRTTAFSETNDHIFFAQWNSTFTGAELWKQNPAEAVGTPVARVLQDNGNSNLSAPVSLNGDLYFSGSDGIVGTELWKRSRNGTVSLVRDLVPGPNGSSIAHLTSFNGLLYFTANHPELGPGLWASDGTSDGTRYLRSVQVVQQTSGAVFTPMGSKLYFSGRVSTVPELWQTDGTASGTRPVFENSAEQAGDSGARALFPQQLVSLNGRLFFSAVDGDHGRELWSSDGTRQGTMLFADIFPGSSYDSSYDVLTTVANSSMPDSLVAMNGMLYFVATSDQGRQLWKSDGTVGGTQSISHSLLSGIRDLKTAGSRLFFAGRSQSHGEELWVTDGTAEGTRLVRDIRPGPLSSEIQSITNVGGVVYFTADDGAHGRELWRSDGTADGTFLVQDILSGIDLTQGTPLSSQPAHLTAVNGVLFFSASDGIGGRELWRTHGTLPGASRVRDIFPGSAGSDPASLTSLDGVLYFSALSESGRGMWRARSAAPVVGPLSSSVTYTEGMPLVRIAPTATVTDSDTPVLSGGRLSVRMINHAPGDQIFLAQNQQLHLAGNVVSFRSVVVGSFSIAPSGIAITIDLNQNATHQAVQAILRSVAYRHLTDNPVVSERRIRVDLTDGASAAASARVFRVSVNAVNDRPVISGLPGEVSYQQNHSAGVLIAAQAVVHDPDSQDFAGGVLRVVLSGSFSGAGRLTFSGSSFQVDANRNLYFQSLLIGTVSENGGTGLTPLEVTWNSHARATHVQRLIRALTYSTSGSSQTGRQRITLTLSDGDGGISSAVSTLVNVQL